MSFTLYIMALAALVLHLPATVLAPAVWPFAVLIGLVASWRYGWGLVHLLRALVYCRLLFPRRRAGLTRLIEDAKEDEGDRQALFPELLALLPVGRNPAGTTVAALQGLIAEAEGYAARVTIVVTVAETGDERLVRRIFRQASPPDRVRLVLVTPPDPGPQAALAAGLAALSRQRPDGRALALLLDPRAVLLPGTLERTVPFLALRPELGLLTTDQDTAAGGDGPFRAWRTLHLARRQLLWSSFALGDRVPPGEDGLLVLPAGLATHPDLLARVRDAVATGTRETVWRWLADRGHAAMHVADVRVPLVEAPPARRALPLLGSVPILGFLQASTATLRTEADRAARALPGFRDPGPWRIGPLLWGYLVDQRLGGCVDLLGPVAALLAAVVVGPAVLGAYLAWLMFLWLAEVLALLSVRVRPEILRPLLVGYDRLWSPIVRCRVRPAAINPPAGAPADLADRRSSGRTTRARLAWINGLAIHTLVAAAGFATGALTLPDLSVLARSF